MAPKHDPPPTADPAPTLTAHVRVDAAGPLGGIVVATVSGDAPGDSRSALLAWWRCEEATFLDGPCAREFVLEEGRAELVWRPFAHRGGTGRGVLVVVEPGPPARVVLEHAHEFELASEIGFATNGLDDPDGLASV